METNDKKDWKKLKTAAKPEPADSDAAATPAADEAQAHSEPDAKHSSQGHAADGEGTATSTHETTLRAATTDSSRVPKNRNDEGPTGGNVR